MFGLSWFALDAIFLNFPFKLANSTGQIRKDFSQTSPIHYFSVMSNPQTIAYDGLGL